MTQGDLAASKCQRGVPRVFGARDTRRGCDKSMRSEDRQGGAAWYLQVAYINQSQHKGIDVIVASLEGYSRQGVELAEP